MVLIAHSHSNHVRGLGVLLGAIDSERVMTEGTAASIAAFESSDPRFAVAAEGATLIEAGDDFRLDRIHIRAFPTVHAQQC